MGAERAGAVLLRIVPEPTMPWVCLIVGSGRERVKQKTKDPHTNGVGRSKKNSEVFRG